MLEQQANLSRTEQQLSTGKRLISPADDPIAASHILNLSVSVATTEQFQTNADAAKARLTLEEISLAQSGEILQRVRQLAVQADNDTLNNSDRAAISAEVKLRLGELLSIANSKDAKGEYLFSGFKGTTIPFSGNESNGYLYDGDQGQRFLQIGTTRQVATSDPGDSVFGGINNFDVAANNINNGTGIIKAGSITNTDAYQPHTYSIKFTSATSFTVVNETTSVETLSNQPYIDGEKIQFNGLEVEISGTPAAGDTFTVAPKASDNIFNVLSDLLNTLENTSTTTEESKDLHSKLNNSLNSIDQSLNTITESQTKIGARLNSIDNQVDVNATFAFQTEKAISELQDLDYTEAISRFTLQINALQAAQQSFSRIQNLSLFNFLS